MYRRINVKTWYNHPATKKSWDENKFVLSRYWILTRISMHIKIYTYVKIRAIFLSAFAFSSDVCIRYFLFFSASRSLIKTVDRKYPYNEICQVLAFTRYTYAAHSEDTRKQPYKIIVVFTFLCTHTIIVWI